MSETNELFRIADGNPTEVPGHYTCASATVRGLAMQIDTVDPNSVIPASGGLDFFLMREVSATAPTYIELTSGKPIHATTTGDECLLTSLGNGIVEVEGSTLIKTSSTGLISSSTAKGTALSLQAGKWYVAQSPDDIEGRLLDASLTPEVSGNLRIRIRVARGARQAT